VRPIVHLKDLADDLWIATELLLPARYPDAARWVGQRVPESVAIERLGPGAQETIVESAGVDGVQRLYVTVPVNAGFDTGLYVGIGIDRATAFAEASRLLRQQLWLLGFLSITVVGVAR